MLKILSFCDRQEGVTSFNKNNRVNFYYEKKKKKSMKLSGCLFFENTRKNLESNVVVVFKDLYFGAANLSTLFN